MVLDVAPATQLGPANFNIKISLITICFFNLIGRKPKAATNSMPMPRELVSQRYVARRRRIHAAHQAGQSEQGPASSVRPTIEGNEPGAKRLRLDFEDGDDVGSFSENDELRSAVDDDGHDDDGHDDGDSVSCPGDCHV